MTLFISQHMHKGGRSTNHIFKDFALSILCERHNLKAKFLHPQEIYSSLGINLFSGELTYSNNAKVDDRQYEKLYFAKNLQSNIHLQGYSNSDFIIDLI